MLSWKIWCIKKDKKTTSLKKRTKKVNLRQNKKKLPTFFVESMSQWWWESWIVGMFYPRPINCNRAYNIYKQCNKFKGSIKNNVQTKEIPISLSHGWVEFWEKTFVWLIGWVSKPKKKCQHFFGVVVWFCIMWIEDGVWWIYFGFGGLQMLTW